MRADREDWRSGRQSRTISPWIIFGGASVAIWIVMALYAKPIVINIDKIKAAISWDGKPLKEEQQRPVQHYQSAPQTRQYTYAELEALKRKALQQVIREEQIRQAQSSKQRSFNENNYTPKQIVNTASFQQNQVEQRGSGNLEIRGINLEKRIEDNCPGREGSIERRECRMRWMLESRNR